MALKWNRMKDGMRIEWERERMMWKGMNGKNDGNMMKRKVILKVVLHQEQSGRTFQKILNAHYVMLEKISFQKLNRSLILC